MSETIRVPDIGSGEGEIIEILVKVGDTVEAEQSLVVLESDKASMEIPAPKAGKIAALHVKLGDTLQEGDRVEIYRPLIADPKELRRQRAERSAGGKK